VSPAPTLGERKRHELQLKLESITTDFDDWRARTKEGAPLEKHHSQVKRMTTQLSRLHASTSASLKDADFDVLEVARAIELDVLALHRIWDFFRVKLSQRSIERLRPFLVASDELAWACYAPVCDAVVASNHVKRAAVKEPPLVFLNGGSTPFVQTRQVAYEVEDTMQDGLDGEAFRKLVERLPIPVVGVPWHQLTHLPEILVVAHEIGHVVEFDFAFGEILALQLTKAPVPADRRTAWESWRSEAFADVFGAVATGPAFVGALVDFLAEPKDVIREEARDETDWGEYPTSALRVRLAIEAIRQAGHIDEAKTRLAEWEANFGSKHAMQAYGADVEHIVRAFAGTKFPELGDRSFIDVVAFDTTMHESALAAATAAVAPSALGTRDSRELMAAARLAFEQKPASFHATPNGSKGTAAYLLAYLEKERKKGVRSSPLAPEESEEIRTASDEAAGETLLLLLHDARRLPPPMAGAAPSPPLQPDAEIRRT
jgi:hypothetical protein